MDNTLFNTQKFIDDVNEALIEFGRYTFEDKGPHEVMDLDKYEQFFNNLTPEKALEVMKEVLTTPTGEVATSDNVAYALSSVALNKFDDPNIIGEKWEKLYNFDPVTKEFFDDWF